MQLTSYAFALFAAALLLVYYLVPGKLQWCVLLAASYVGKGDYTDLMII